MSQSYDAHTAPTIHSSPSLAGVIALLEEARLPVSDLTQAHLKHFFYCGSAAEPAGLIGLELYGEQALLRSLVVAPALRSKGVGGVLLHHAESYAREAGVRSIFLLTTTAESFFRQRGYVTMDRTNAPAPIRAAREFSDICPASSAFLVKRLAP